jgi:indoleacetamide hydrolase
MSQPHPPRLVMRRQFSALIAALGGMVASGWPTRPSWGQRHEAVGRKPLPQLNVREVLAGLTSRQFSVPEYVEELLDWQTRWKRINAFIAQDTAAIRAAAVRANTLSRKEFPIAGIPIVMKDNIDALGYATTAGSPGLLKHHPRANAPMLQHVLDHGAIVMGKVGLHELAAGGTCANLTFGQIRNPYNLAMVPGGSSGGTAAAVAARLVPAGLGTDTGGSVREPASFCGVVGFRPTAGRYAVSGVVPRALSHDSIGWMARASGDIALLDSCSGSPLPRIDSISLRGLRLGVPRAYFYENLNPEVAPVIEAALQRLRAAGAQLVEVDFSNLSELRQQIVGPSPGAFARDLRDYLRSSGADVSVDSVIHSIAEPELRTNFERSLAAIDDAKEPYDPAKDAGLQAFRRAYAEYFATHRLAAAVIPTTPDIPFPVPTDPSHGGNRAPSSGVRNTGPTATAGFPGLSVPAGRTRSGLPVGIEFDGPPLSDATLFAIGSAFESITEPLPPPVPPA